MTWTARAARTVTSSGRFWFSCSTQPRGGIAERRVECGELSLGMNAGVGAAASARPRGARVEREDGAAERLLDRARVLLGRPSREGAPVVRDGEQDAMLVHPPSAWASVGARLRPRRSGSAASRREEAARRPSRAPGAATHVRAEQTPERQSSPRRHSSPIGLRVSPHATRTPVNATPIASSTRAAAATAEPRIVSSRRRRRESASASLCASPAPSRRRRLAASGRGRRFARVRRAVELGPHWVAASEQSGVTPSTQPMSDRATERREGATHDGRALPPHGYCLGTKLIGMLTSTQPPLGAGNA